MDSEDSEVTEWVGDPNTPHSWNPFTNEEMRRYAIQAALDLHNTGSMSEIRPPPYELVNKRPLKTDLKPSEKSTDSPKRGDSPDRGQNSGSEAANRTESDDESIYLAPPSPRTAAMVERIFKKGQKTEAKYGPQFFPSKTGMRKGDPNPNHPSNRSSSSEEESSSDDDQNNKRSTKAPSNWPTKSWEESAKVTRGLQQKELDHYQSIAKGNYPKTLATTNKEVKMVVAHTDDEELDYLLLIKVKKGEKKLHVRNVLNNDTNEYQGPFVLGASVHHLIQHHNRAFPGKFDKWKEPPETFREKKVFPGIKGTKGGTKITLEQLLESQRKSSLQAQRESREESIPCVLGPIGRRYEMGQRVYYFIEEVGNEK
jgi:hypothetical protein